MNYQWHYDNLINTRKLLNRKRNDGYYYEKHHIVMKSMGGNDSKENLILLTAREHFIAHWLLWRIYRNKESAWAFNGMCNFSKNYSSKAYTESKEAISIFGQSEETCKKKSKSSKEYWKNLSKKNRKNIATKIGNALRGKSHTEESKRNMSEGHNHLPLTKETKRKMSIKLKGKKRPKISKALKNRIRTKESAEKISKSLTGRKLSKETKLKISNELKGKSKPKVSKALKGRKLSEERKAKVSKSCEIDGIYYKSMSLAAKILKTSPNTIRFKINSELYPSWFLINKN